MKYDLTIIFHCDVKVGKSEASRVSASVSFKYDPSEAQFISRCVNLLSFKQIEMLKEIRITPIYPDNKPRNLPSWMIAKNNTLTFAL